MLIFTDGTVFAIMVWQRFVSSSISLRIKEFCSLCGQCVIEFTGGLSPMTLCAKACSTGLAAARKTANAR